MRYMGEMLRSRRCARCLRHAALTPAYLYCAINGAALAILAARISSKNPHEADIGYALLPEAQGKGYASEALRALRVRFQQLGVQAINAWVLVATAGHRACWKNTVLCAFRCWKKPII
jgi:L-amino acid N-acyltransferase YncA